MKAMKLLGLSTGAGLAALGLYGWSTLTHVSDEDRLTAAILDHCLPYVQTGAAPFAGVGRQAGVYERGVLDNRLANHAILHDDRFVAQWGEGDDMNSPVRICKIDGRPNRGTLEAFAVPEDVVSRLTDALAGAGVEPDTETLPRTATVIGWFEPGVEIGDGLRIVLTTNDVGVTSVLVGDDL